MPNNTQEQGQESKKSAEIEVVSLMKPTSGFVPVLKKSRPNLLTIEHHFLEILDKSFTSNDVDVIHLSAALSHFAIQYHFLKKDNGTNKPNPYLSYLKKKVADNDYWDKILQFITKNLSKLNEDHLLNLIKSVEILNKRNSDLMRGISMVFLKKELEGLSPAALATIAWTYAKLNCRHEALLSSIAGKAIKLKFEGFNGSDIAKMMYAYTQFKNALDVKLAQGLVHALQTAKAKLSNEERLWALDFTLVCYEKCLKFPFIKISKKEDAKETKEFQESKKSQAKVASEQEKNIPTTKFKSKLSRNAKPFVPMAILAKNQKTEKSGFPTSLEEEVMMTHKPQKVSMNSFHS